MEKNQPRGEPAMLLACSPFSSPRKVRGVWVVGFEMNEFFAGEWPDEPPPLSRDSDTELVVTEQQSERLRSSAPYDVLWVELTGRHSLCPFTSFTPDLIVVEDIEVRRRAPLIAR